MQLVAAEVDLERGTVRRADGELRELLPTELALLRYFAARPGTPLGRNELLVEVWGYRDGVRSRTVDTTVKTLRRKIEADPSKPDHLRTVHGAGYCFEPLPAPTPTAGNLPHPADPLFGREDDVALLTEALRGQDRLVTLVGPGGIGKTRLALAVAAEVGFPGGAWFCDLTEDRTADDVLGVVARVLEVALRPADRGATIGRALAARGPALLVLDNAEGLDAGAAAAIAELVRSAPAARWLVTSRRPLRVRGERRHEVPPLPEDAATALLGERGRRVRPSFGQGEEDALRAIVRQLEGLPLAIELAAARAGLLTARSLAERVGSLGLLDRGPADAPERHRTLRATLAWTLDLLGEPERDALSQCAVFAGGFTVDAAEHVLRVQDRPALDAVEALREWSLLAARTHPELDQVRLRLLEAVRAFVLEVRPPDGRVRARHAAWAVAAGARLATTADRHGGAQALQALAAEVLNLRAVLDHGAPEEVVAAAKALDRVLVHQGLFVERLDAAERAVAAGGSAVARAVAAGLRAHARQDLGQPGADEDLERARLHAGEAGDPALDAAVLATRSVVRIKQGRLDEAAGAAVQALALHRAQGDRAGEADRLSNLGRIHLDLGRHDAAHEALAAALPLQRAVGNRTGTGKVLGMLGELYELRSDLDEAQRYFRRALESHREVGYRPGVVRMQGNLGLVAGGRGDFDASSTAFRAAVEEATRLGDRVVERVGLMGLARAEVFRGRPTEALEAAEQALALLPEGDDPFAAGTWSAVAAARGAAGRLEASVRASERAEALLELPRAARTVVRLRCERAVLHATHGDLATAAAHLARAAALASPEDQAGTQILALARAFCTADDAAARDLLAAVGPPTSDLAHWVARRVRDRLSPASPQRHRR